MEYLAKDIRNVAVFGHQGVGKTALVESLVALTGGDTGNKNARGGANEISSSKSLSVAPVFYKNTKINFIDLPGNDDFVFEALGIVELIEGAILVLDAAKGVEVETVKHFNILKKHNVPTFVLLNKNDKDDAKFDDVVSEIEAKLGRKPIVFTTPVGKGSAFKSILDAVEMKLHAFEGDKDVEKDIPGDLVDVANGLHDAISEQVALSDDALLDKFFGGEKLSKEEIEGAITKGVSAGEYVPVLAGSAQNNVGLTTLLDMVVAYVSSPLDAAATVGKDASGKEVSRKASDDEPFSAYVFKTTYNSYSGVTNIAKIISGVLSNGDEVLVASNGETQTVSNISIPCYEKRTPVTSAHAGDIIALNKLDDVHTTDTLCAKKNVVSYKLAKYPTPVFYQAIKTRNKNDEEKLGGAIAKLRLEDPVLETKRNNETKQFLIGGTSETHVAYVVERLKSLYNITVDTEPRKIVYRETIKATAEAEGRYVKQSGGSGFYGVVVMRFERNKESDDNVFAEEIFGGSVPKNYFPAVEKGFYESLKEGALAGFPVIGVKATLIDGKYHPVDSNEQAFKMAAVFALREAYQKCQPTILEPIIEMKIHVLQEFVGNVMNDLSNRRARIMNMEDNASGESEITALVPEAEIVDYVSKLRTLTQGSGYFNIKFDSYKEVPSNLIENVLRDNSMKKDK